MIKVRNDIKCHKGNLRYKKGKAKERHRAGGESER